MMAGMVHVIGSARRLPGKTERGRPRRGSLVSALALLAVLALPGCGATALPTEPSPTAAKVAEVHVSPTCTCCTEYVAYLRRHGWTVEVVEEPDIAAFQDEQGVPEAARGCHTTLVGGYLVEGHVPLAAIDRLLEERPAVDGIGLPGMPLGSPGMTGTATEPLAVVAFDGDEVGAFGEY